MPCYDDLFLLDGLSAEEKQSVISGLPQPVSFKKGDQIYSSATYRRAIAYIVKGTAVADADNDSRVFMRRFTPGMCFGAAAVFGGGDTFVSTVSAQTDAEILFISEQCLAEIFAKYPVAAVNYITFLSDKIRFLNSKISVISCSSAEDTVLKYLKNNADGSGTVILPKMTLLSRALGLGRASLYRSLDALEASGSIKREKNYIKVI